METPIREFENINWEFTHSTIIAIAVFLLALALFLFLYQRKTPYYKRKEKQLQLLLLAFTMLIALGMGVFSWLSTVSMQKITVSKQAIELPNEKIKLSKIKNAYIYLHLEKSGLSANIIKDTVRMLIIEERDGQTHAISEENYDIDTVFEALKEFSPPKK